jgi:hypothetical protein
MSNESCAALRSALHALLAGALACALPGAAAAQQIVEGNMVANPWVNEEIRPNHANKHQAEPPMIVDAPEMLRLVMDTRTGQGRALQVTIAKDPAFGYYSHNSGLAVPLLAVVPPGHWLRVGFWAKSISGGTQLQIQKTWGGSMLGYARIDATWKHYDVYIQTVQEFSSVLFSPVPEASANAMQSVENAVFLIDDFEVVPTSASAVPAAATAGMGDADLHAARLAFERAPRTPTTSLGEVLQPAATLPDGRGRSARLESGSVYATPQTGAHVVWGPIRDRWEALGAHGGKYGYPVTDSISTPDGSRYVSNFEGGLIYYDPATGTVLPMLWAGP